MRKYSSHSSIQWPSLPDAILHKAYQRAQALRITFSDYVKQLIVQDTKVVQGDPWIPVPQHVLDRWDREVKQFQKEERQGLHKSYHSIEELKADLDA
jgi:hypothetical protein